MHRKLACLAFNIFCRIPNVVVILRSNQSLTLWLRYLEFKARHFGPFTVPNQRSTYARCIRALESKREETKKSLGEEQRAKGVFIMVSTFGVICGYWCSVAGVYRNHVQGCVSLMSCYNSDVDI